MICPYCDKDAEWCENKKVYGKNYGKSYMIYYCEPCNAYVGCHENSKRPLGTMADGETRRYRRLAHSAFDVLWKKWNHRDIEYGLDGKDRKALKSQRRMRKKMYEFLRIGLKSETPIHIGESNIDRCKEIINWVCLFKKLKRTATNERD